MVLTYLPSPPEAGVPLQQNVRQSSKPAQGATTIEPAQPRTIKFALQENHGSIPWIEFPYTQPDGRTLHYTIRCDIDWFDFSQLSAEFKAQNTLYADAAAASSSPSSSFSSSASSFASDHDSSSFEQRNALGWVLAYLNPPLCAPRNPGLLLLAVKSWMAVNGLVQETES